MESLGTLMRKDMICMQRYRAVVFDLFGTLVPSWRGATSDGVVAEMALLLGAERERFTHLWNAATWHERATGVFDSTEANVVHICDVMGIVAPQERVRAAAEIRHAFTRESLTPRPGAEATLRMLRDRGHTLGLLSDCAPDVPLLWEGTAFSGLIEYPVFSCGVGARKPDPSMYRAVCGRMAIDACDCLFIGDGLDEVIGARAFGMDAVLFRIPPEEAGGAGGERTATWDGAAITDLSQVVGLATLNASGG
jgi:putative hydrolase of the HAD superfamily